MIESTRPAGRKCVGFARETALTTAKPLPSIPAGVDTAHISVEGGNVRWRADGTDPTNDIGNLILADKAYNFRGPFAAVRFIRDDTGETPAITVSYYSL